MLWPSFGRQREATRPGAIGLPERAAALPAVLLLALQLLAFQRQALVVQGRSEAGRAAEAAHGRAVLVAEETAAAVDGRPLGESRIPPFVLARAVEAFLAAQERKHIQEPTAAQPPRYVI